MGKGRTRITNHIRQLRFHKNEMTQAELAEQIGVTRQTVIAMEQARYSPSLEVAFRTAIALDTAITEVFFYDEEADSGE